MVALTNGTQELLEQYVKLVGEDGLADLLRGEMTACACMGAAPGDPLCRCIMASMGPSTQDTVRKLYRIAKPQLEREEREAQEAEERQESERIAQRLRDPSRLPG